MAVLPVHCSQRRSYSTNVSKKSPVVLQATSQACLGACRRLNEGLRESRLQSQVLAAHRQIILNFFWDFDATYPQNDTCQQIPSTYDTVTPLQSRALKSHANRVAPVLPLRLTATQDKCDLNVRGLLSKTAPPSHSLDKIGNRG